MNEQEQFLKSTEQDHTKVDVLEQPLVPQEEVKQEEAAIETPTEGEDGELKPRNRRERRLIDKLQAERESSMFLAGKLEARTEATSALEESDYLKGVEKIYGSETPEAQIAGDLLKKALIGARDEAEERAYQRIKSEREAEYQERQKANQELDSYIDDIEDTYSVSLTEAQEKSYFQLLHKMSPKDRDGDVIEYADPHAVWEIYQDKLKANKPDNRAKDLSSRSMVQSGASKENDLQMSVNERYLRENGII